MGHNHDPERQLSAYTVGASSSHCLADFLMSSLPTVRRAQTLDDRGWQSIGCFGTVTAEIVWNRSRDTGAPQTSNSPANSARSKKTEAPSL